MFSLFDVNHNGHVDFGEFVRSLSIFHPKTPEADKILCKNISISMYFNMEINFDIISVVFY